MSIEWRRVLAVVTMALLVTAVITTALRVEESRDDEARLQDAAESVASNLGRELDRIASLGSDVAAVLSFVDGMDGPTYAQLVQELQIETRFPAMLGFNVVQRIDRSRLDEFVRLRQQEDARFRVRNDAGRPDLRVITYVHPRTINALALGLDVTSRSASFEASRRSEMTGAPALSNVTQLVQLPSGEPGAVMHLPVSESGGEVTTWLNIAFAGADLLAVAEPLPAPVAVRVRDRGSPEYDLLGSIRTPADVGMAPVRVPLERFGQRWEVEVLPAAGFSVPVTRRASTLGLAGGLLTAGLLAGLVWALSSGERRAQALARQRTDELAEVNTALHAANRTKDEFLASVSHELRTPLTVIAGFVESLRRMHGQQADIAVLLDPIDRNVRRLDGLVADLLTLAGLDAGAVAVFAGPVPLASLLRELPAELAGVPDEDVRIEVEGEPIADVDRRHLERVLINLLVNAVRHGAPPIVLRARAVADPPTVVLQVRDHGAGIAPEFESHLFGRFTRGPEVDRSTGTGLGLAIVRELVELNGGTVRYDGTAGACFEVRLPAAASADITPAPSPADANSRPAEPLP